MRNSQAIHLNSEAVKQMKAGNLLSAHKFIGKALQVATSVMMHEGVEQAELGFCHAAVNKTALLKAGGDHSADSSAFLLFLWPLEINVADAQELVVDAWHPKVYTWAIEYNYALTCALMGMGGGGGRGGGGGGLLETALRRYGSVRRHISCYTRPNRIILSVLNNQACICRELGMADKLSEYFDLLSYAVQDMREGDLIGAEMFSANIQIFRNAA